MSESRSSASVTHAFAFNQAKNLFVRHFLDPSSRSVSSTNVAIKIIFFGTGPDETVQSVQKESRSDASHEGEAHD